MTEPLGIYIHIPFCIQRCSYCDFATYAKDEISPNQSYVDTLLLEAQKRRHLFDETQIQTIYFGGGTPSLLEPKQITQIINEFKKLNFEFCKDIEITLEVNPATLDETKCIALKEAGVNRISIGCQSFNDEALKNCNREHDSNDTLRTIALAKKHFKNYSLDLLFSLPKQGLEQLSQDLHKMAEIDPPHISAYCLTLNDKHPMNKDRCSDEEQVKMFALIFESFRQQGLNRYEISNFSKPSFESKHNNLYWTDSNFWGLGLSAHSYRKKPSWGTRFWNPSTYSAYIQQIQELGANLPLEQSFSAKNYEKLRVHESLTDFCHTSLRMQKGLQKRILTHKFGPRGFKLVEQKASRLLKQELLAETNDSWALTDFGILLSNKVFGELLFSSTDIDNSKV